MSLIDSTYFIGDIALPNLDEVSNSFADFITRYETELLKKLLGYTLWKEFTDALDAGSPAQKWVDLRDGAEFSFEFEGVTVTTKWGGLINTDLESVIAYYVYYKYRQINLSTTTSINDVVGLPENATKVNDVRKMAYAWNEMLKLYGDLYSYVPEWMVNTGISQLKWFYKYDSNYQHYNDEPSAYNFILANRTDYDNWVFEPLERLNEFGI